MASTNKISLKFLLIGKTGHGKSATGNSILDRKEFRISSNSKSATKDVKDAFAENSKYEVQVVDGPGLEDTDLSEIENNEQACENMATALMMCNGGVHSFLLVIKFGGRFTQEERRTVSVLKCIFGENYLKERGIVVLTCGDQFHGNMEAEDTPDKTIQAWCREQDDDMKSLFEECSYRIVLFNNFAKTVEEKEKQRNELFSLAEKLIKTKGLYTSEHFLKFAEQRKALIEDSKITLLKDTMQRKINLLTAELGCMSKGSSVEDVEHLEKSIDNLKREILEQGGESLQSLSDDLERLLQTCQQLKIAIIDKETTDIRSYIEALHQMQKDLEKTRETPWKSIFVGIGAGLAVGAVIVGGAAAFSASGGSLAALAPVGRALAPLGRALLSLAVAFVEKKMKQL